MVAISVSKFSAAVKDLFAAAGYSLKYWTRMSFNNPAVFSQECAGTTTTS